MLKFLKQVAGLGVFGLLPMLVAKAMEKKAQTPDAPAGPPPNPFANSAFTPFIPPPINLFNAPPGGLPVVGAPPPPPPTTTPPTLGRPDAPPAPLQALDSTVSAALARNAPLSDTELQQLRDSAFRAAYELADAGSSTSSAVFKVKEALFARLQSLPADHPARAQLEGLVSELRAKFSDCSQSEFQAKQRVINNWAA